MDNRFLQAALVYFERGWCVIPCKPGTKVPAVDWKKYQENRTTKEQIKEWWSKWPDANVAIVTGEISGITLIDIDGSKGIESLTMLPEPLPDTRKHKTPHGTHHLYQYQSLLYTGANFLPGIDVRNDGGIAVMPPSIVDGEEYKVEANSDVFARFDLPPDILYNRRTGVSETNGPIGDGSYLQWLVNAYNDGAGEGERNNTAHQLASFFRTRNIPPEFVSAILADYAERCDPPMDLDELETTINSAQKYPTQMPTELSPDKYKIDVSKVNIPRENRGEIITYTEQLNDDIELTLKATNIRKEKTGIHARIEIIFNGLILAWTNFNIERDSERVTLNNSAYSKLPDNWEKQIDKRVMKQWLDEFTAVLWDLYLGQLEAMDHVITEIKEQVFLIKPYVMPEAGTIIFAPPGQGKSWTGIAMAICLDSGNNTIWNIPRAEKVLFLNLERSGYSVGRRIAQVNQALGLPVDRPLLTINGRGRTLEDVHEAILKAIETYGVKLVLVDSISRAGASGSLTENTFANRIMDLLNGLEIAWLGLAHSPRADASHIYGSQMFDAAADVIIQLTSDDNIPNHLGIGLTVTKANDIAKPKQMKVDIGFDETGLIDINTTNINMFIELEIASKSQNNGTAILEYLRDGEATVKEIVANTGISRRTVAAFIKASQIIITTHEYTSNADPAKYGFKLI